MRLARRTKRAFTIIELLTVMAISAILLTIIAIPMIQGFNLTRASQAFAESQDKARKLIVQIQKEVSNASVVRDNTGFKGTVNVPVPGQTVGSTELVSLEGAKLDFYKPAEGDASDFVISGGRKIFINPDTGKLDPTLRAPKGQANLPAAPGQTLVRYFVGLRDPFTSYNNPYDGILMARNGARDNLFVLYRAEVQTHIFDSASNAYVVNANLFFDQDNDTDPNTTGPLLDDPNFFINDGNMGGTYGAVPPGWGEPGITPSGGPSKDLMLRNWLRRAKVVTEVSRYDMVMPVFDKASKQVTYIGNKPQVFSMVRFQPTRMTNEPAQGQLAVRTGEELFNADKIGPDTYLTEYGSWSNLFMRVYPSSPFFTPGRLPGQQLDSDPRQAWSSTEPFMIGRLRPAGGGYPSGMSSYYFNPLVNANELTDGVEVFDIDEYWRARGDGSFNGITAFSRAVAFANARSGWLASKASMDMSLVFAAPDPKTGRVVSSFDVGEVGTVPASLLLEDNYPRFGTGPTLTPDNDPSVGAGIWSDAVFSNVNGRFNKMWTDWATLGAGLPREDYCKRFVDLRMVPMTDGTPSPLNPIAGYPKTLIVPGSEIVMGPDQKPGPNYGQPVRYTRVTKRPVGPNQYYINYVPQRPPDWVALGIAVAGPDEANFYAPKFLAPTDFRHAVLRAQYEKGYVELNSNKNEPLPPGNIVVSYRFQFTEAADVVAVDYDSSQVMETVLTIRNYAQSSLPEPQMITVKGSASVRNFLR